MKISHIVVSGCSWSYGLELANPREQGWAAIVAKKLKVPIVNLSIPGSGNDAIHRRIYEYLLEDSINNSNPLYIIGWSQTWRREAWCRKIYYDTDAKYQGYHGVSLPYSSAKNHLEYAVFDTWSEEDFYRKTMLNRLSVDALFRSRGIPYIESFFSDIEFNYDNGGQIDNGPEIIKDVKKRFSNTVIYLKKNINNLAKPFYKIAEGFNLLPHHHHGPEANMAIATYILDHLKKTYGEITPINQKYLSLVDYLRISDQESPKWKDWL